MKHDLAALKERLRIPEVWERLGLPGTPALSCRSPFRRDNKPSFSVYDEGRRWKDHSTGEGGDVIDFIAIACNVDSKAATQRFLAMAGVPVDILPAPPRASIHRPGVLCLPPLRRGTPAELEAVAQSRRIHSQAVALAQSMGTVMFSEVCGFPCWLLTDAARRIAEARRINGKPFPVVGTLGERKAHTIKGSCKAWPAGVAVLRELSAFRAIMLVEGGPDYLAALHFVYEAQAWDILPVAMLGRSAGAHIAPEALALLRGRRVRIYPHADADGGGETSAHQWCAQLQAAGCQVDGFTFAGLHRRDGRPVKDLNDAALISPEQLTELSSLLP